MRQVSMDGGRRSPGSLVQDAAASVEWGDFPMWVVGGGGGSTGGTDQEQRQGLRKVSEASVWRGGSRQRGAWMG